MHYVSSMKGLNEVLWIYGESDTDTPPEMGERLRNASNIPSKLWIVPGGEHAKCYDKDPDTYFRVVRDFFDKSAGGAPHSVNRVLHSPEENT